MKTGCVYLLANDSMPGMYKIGSTTRDVQVRVKELSAATSVPTPFKILLAVGTHYPESVERHCHKRLAGCRVNGKREFFSFSCDALACQKLVASIGSCAQYCPPTCDQPSPVKEDPAGEDVEPEQETQTAEEKYQSGMKAIMEMRERLNGR